MSHVRMQIRQRAVSLLEAHPDLVGRVHASRAYTIDDTPCALVYTTTEAVEAQDLRGTLNRELSFVVEAITRPGPEADDELDELARVIEQTLGPDTAFAGLAQEWHLTATEITFAAGAGKVGTARITYSITYRTSPGDPETPLGV